MAASSKTPEEKALADVEKAWRDYEKASKKRVDAQAKIADLEAAQIRADKTLIWTASHPDLPDDFNVDEFVESLKEPFPEDESESDADALADEREFQEGPGGDGAVPANEDPGDGEQPPNELGPQAPTDDADPFGDDPFGDEPEPEPAPAPRGRGRTRR